MNFLSARLIERIAGIEPEDATFKRRGFREGRGEAQARLETFGATFLAGYQLAIRTGNMGRLVLALDESAPALRGFAYEGAAMGLALLDWLTPWNRQRLKRFLANGGDKHAYMVHVGSGWVLARVPGSVDRFIRRFDPLLRWLAIDGYGFHEGFFHWREYMGGKEVPQRLSGYARRVFDQGFGRSLWFIEAADVEQIPKTIGRLGVERHSDLWSGVGLAATYAGEVPMPGLKRLRRAAGPYLPELAQGAAFAAKARVRAGNLTPYQEAACKILCGTDAHAAAAITDEALENLPSDGAVHAYETWRCRIQHRLKSSLETMK